MTLTLSMTSVPYDRLQAFIDGAVKPEGIDLDIAVNDDDVARQQQAAQGHFDGCEFFAGTYIAEVPFKKLGSTAIPVFVERAFRHSSIYINKRSGIRKPHDLNGRRVAVQNWITALWAKGMLKDDHGVDRASIEGVAWQPVRVPDWKPPKCLRLAPAGVGR